jgi:hypothetical protein
MADSCTLVPDWASGSREWQAPAWARSVEGGPRLVAQRILAYTFSTERHARTFRDLSSSPWCRGLTVEPDGKTA